MSPLPPATPAPTAQATPTPSAFPAPRTLAELRARLQEIVRQPGLAPALYGVKVASLDTGQVLFEENANKLLVPASNMKLYTVAAALDRLTPDFRFVTSVYAAERPNATGTVRGDLTIYGRGDPTFAMRFNDGDYYKAVEDLAARIVAAGVKRVEGDLIGDESYFNGATLGPGWEWDDLQWYYGAEVSALTVNDNAIDLFVKPGGRAGAAAQVTTGPIGSLIRVVAPRGYEDVPAAGGFITFVNRTTTAARGAKRELVVNRPLGSSVIEVSGALPLDDPGYSASVAAPRPTLLFAAMLRLALEHQGVSVKGRTRTVDARARATAPLDMTKLVELAQRQSPPLSEVAAQTLKPSQNLYTELILRTLGKQALNADPKLSSAEAGTAVVKIFLGEAGVDVSLLSFVDGSGLSRSNLVTADSSLRLLTYMSRHRFAQVFRDALPIAGVDGTLRARMKNTPAAGNVRAKTGTLNNVAALSGYVNSAAGERLVFSVIYNHQPAEGDLRRTYLDAVAALLASFAGKSQ